MLLSKQICFPRLLTPKMRSIQSWSWRDVSADSSAHRILSTKSDGEAAHAGSARSGICVRAGELASHSSEEFQFEKNSGISSIVADPLSATASHAAFRAVNSRAVWSK